MGQPELTVMDIFRKQLIETTYTRFKFGNQLWSLHIVNVCTNCNCLFICMPLSIIRLSYSQQCKAGKTIIQCQNQIKPCQHKLHTANQTKLNMKS